MSLLFPNTNTPDVLRYVSWNEFLYQMLAKGEVEQLVVRPELDLVTIYLYDGAVIKGKRAEHKTYHMNIVNVSSFERRLREAERWLGIKTDAAVPVVYERNQESTWLLLVSLVAVSLMILIMFRSGQIKTPVNVDFFVSIDSKTCRQVLKHLFALSLKWEGLSSPWLILSLVVGKAFDSKMWPDLKRLRLRSWNSLTI